MSAREAKFCVGQLVRHALFGYRGVVTDVDGSFQLSDEWYEQVARTRPPRDQPWYHVLVHDSDHVTYVAERNLHVDPETRPIEHPLLSQYFDRFSNGRYEPARRIN